MFTPVSTYRIQFNKDFTFRHFEKIIDYLHELGISTIYASPITTADAGSMHGYDVTDPLTINPEIGTLEELESISRKLKKRGMTWIQDIVPNHMAFSTANKWLMDVLERGPASSFYTFFDIDWQHPDPLLTGKLMVPVLGQSLEQCIADRQIQVQYDISDGLTVSYVDQRFPLSLSAYAIIAAGCREEDPKLADALEQMTSSAMTADWKDWLAFKKEQLSALKKHSTRLKSYVSQVNADQVRLNEILVHQFYRFYHYSATDKLINYRRFFTVNNLICLSMERAEVFAGYHPFILQLYQNGLIQGLRIDHIDGLNDPGEYIHRLRNLFGDECYIIVEKILEAQEDMPSHWPLQGTSGYEFLSYVNQLTTDRHGAGKLRDHYKQFLQTPDTYDETVFQKKKLILDRYMCGELDNLARLLCHSTLTPEHVDPARLKEALALVMLNLPVYRTYPEKLPLAPKELELMELTFNKAQMHSPSLKPEFDQLRNIFYPAADGKDGERLSFIKRVMQFTGPLTAKGVEDTSFYVYNALISHNEVGDSPSVIGIRMKDYHDKMLKRAKQNPLSLNTTATHDTKRGEDARMRINMLSEYPVEWSGLVNEWIEINKPLLSTVNGLPSPSLNDEYFIYQSLIGGFPGETSDLDNFSERLKAYFIKVLRESKVNSSWDRPNNEYEQACVRFIDGLLSHDHPFLGKFLPFFDKVAANSVSHSLNQALIKITSPGIPDFYQGCEFGDFSYVDPDNRRPVDYDLRKKRLEGILSLAKKVNKHIDWPDQPETQKLLVINRALSVRNELPELFIKGSYIPLTSNEPAHILAYARHLNDDWVITIVYFGIPPVSNDSAQDVFRIELPPGAPAKWLNVINRNEAIAQNSVLEFRHSFRNAGPILVNSYRPPVKAR